MQHCSKAHNCDKRVDLSCGQRRPVQSLAHLKLIKSSISHSHCGLQHSLLPSFLHPCFLIAELEETVVCNLAGWVVRIQVNVLLLVDWLLYVPEHVSGDSVEDLAGKRLSETFLVSIGQILGIIVLLTILEDGELSIKIFVPFVDGQVVGLDFFHQGDSQVFLFFSFKNLLAVGSFELSANTLLVHTVCQFLLSNLVDNSSVCVTRRSGKGVEQTLGKGTLVIFDSGLDGDRSLGLVSVK
jgi:hypothetical protein